MWRIKTGMSNFLEPLEILHYPLYFLLALCWSTRDPEASLHTCFFQAAASAGPEHGHTIHTTEWASVHRQRWAPWHLPETRSSSQSPALLCCLPRIPQPPLVLCKGLPLRFILFFYLERFPRIWCSLSTGNGKVPLLWLWGPISSFCFYGCAWKDIQGFKISACSTALEYILFYTYIV